MSTKRSWTGSACAVRRWPPAVRSMRAAGREPCAIPGIFALLLTLCGCTQAMPPVQAPAPTMRQAVPVRVAPIAPVSLEAAVVGALLKAADASPAAPEVEVTVRGRRYVCIVRPLSEMRAGVITAETLWQVYVREELDGTARSMVFGEEVR